MTKYTFTFTELVSDYRKVFNLIKSEKDSTVYYPVTFRKHGINYEILKLSEFNQDIDNENNVLKVMSRKFKDNTAFFLNFVRYGFANLIITVNHKPKFVIEPGLDLVSFMLDRLNIESKIELKNILLNGQLPVLLAGGDQKKLNKKIKSLIKQCDKIESEKLELKSENAKVKGECAQVTDKLGVASRQSNEYRDLFLKASNPELH